MVSPGPRRTGAALPGLRGAQHGVISNAPRRRGLTLPTSRAPSPPVGGAYGAEGCSRDYLLCHHLVRPRGRVRRAEVDAAPGRGPRPRNQPSSSGSSGENAELRRANEILKAAAGFFAAELDRPQVLIAFIDAFKKEFGGRADLPGAVCARHQDRTVHLLRRQVTSGLGPGGP